MLYVIRMLNVTKLFSPIYTSLLVITCVWIVLFDKYLTFLNFSLSLNIRTSLNGIRFLNLKHISKSTKRKRQNVKQLPSFTGCPRKNVPLEESRTSAKATFFLGHLVDTCVVKNTFRIVRRGLIWFFYVYGGGGEFSGD